MFEAEIVAPLPGELSRLPGEVELRDAGEVAGGRDLEVADLEGRARVELDAEPARDHELARGQLEEELAGLEGGGDLAVLERRELERRAGEPAAGDRRTVRLEFHDAVLDLALEMAGELDEVRRAVAPGPERPLSIEKTMASPDCGCAAVSNSTNGRRRIGLPGKAVTLRS